MKIFWTIILVILTLLAVFSGVAKIMLMEQEVAFFGKYGFSNPILIAYGAVQLIGGALLPFPRTRLAGAALVVLTFLVSLVVLLMDGNIPMSAITLVATVLAGIVMLRSRKPGEAASEQSGVRAEEP